MQEIWKEYPYDKRYKVSSKGRFKGLKGQILKQYTDKVGYPTIQLGRYKMRSHLFVAETFLKHKRCGHRIVVDHIDNNPQNNRIDNLQLTTHRYNLSKDKKNKTSRYTGVSKDHKKYRSQVCLGGKVYFLGLYDTEISAYEAKLDALNEYNKFINNIY
jgi:hypothetical protein